MSEPTAETAVPAANRRYAEAAAGHPAAVPTSSLGIARELINRARSEQGASAVVAPQLSAESEIPEEPDTGLASVARAFEAIGARFRAASSPAAFPVALPEASREEVSLATHTDNLVRQQSYRDTEAEHGSLRDFVRNIQACPRDPEAGVPGYADPFSRLLAASLPGKNRLAGNPSFNVAEVRRDFPILRQRVNGRTLVWFDNAATTQKPRQVIDGLKRFYEEDNSNIHRGAHTLAARATDAFEGARDKIRAFLNAGSSEEVIFVRGTTEGINLVARSYGARFLKAGDEILLSELEHHANIVPWQLVAKETGAVIRVIPADDNGEIDLGEYRRLLGPRTRLVGLAHANNSLGTVLPVAEMTHLAKRNGSHVLIDGAQSVAHLPVDVQALGVDFFIFSGHKIFGPTGIGAVYGRREILEELPPWQGGGNMIRDVTFEETTYADIPARFEAGTPNVADAYGLGLALDYVRSVGLGNIAAHEHRLLGYATEQLRSVSGLTLVGNAPEKVAVTSFVLRDKPVAEVGKYLDRHGIAVRAGHHCAQPSLRRFGLEATVRPSYSFYNTFEEIDRLVLALKQLR